MDTRLALMAGTDIPIPECQLILHQPTIKQIAFIGETDFFIGVQTLCLHKSMFISQEEDKAVSSTITNFQIFMTIVSTEETKDKKEKALKVLQLLFPKYKILFTPKSLIFSDEGGNHIVDDSNFEILQDTLRLVFCSQIGPMDQQAFNPANDKAKEIAEKLMRGRQRVAAQNGDKTSSIFSQYLSTITVGLHISMAELINYTMYQIFDIMERYSLYMNWDIDLRCRLAGGKPDSQPDNWMKNIH